MSQHAKYGEPWRRGETPTTLKVLAANGMNVMYSFKNMQHSQRALATRSVRLDRAVACVNALAAYGDPAKAVEAMEAVAHAAAVLFSCGPEYKFRATDALRAAFRAYDDAKGEG